MTKIEVISQNLKKTEFLAKLAIFLHFLAKKPLIYEFSQGYGYYYTEEDTYKKVLGSFQPNLTTKFKVISKKPSKNGHFVAKNPYFRPPGGQKAVKMNFWEKSKNVTLLHSLILSYMQKIRKI